jgi:hypothetical protein
VSMSRRIKRNIRSQTVRIITLPKDREEAESMFNLFYTAAFAGEGSENQAAARKLGKLQDALEDVSHEESLTSEEAEGTEEKTKRVLDEKCKKITLEDAHWSSLKDRFFGAGIKWHPSVSRKVIQAFDLVEGAEEKKPGGK